MRLVARLQILNHSSIHAKDHPVTLFLQICLTLLKGRLMSAICQVPLVCLPSSVTMWRHFSPRLDKLLPLAALYFCPIRLPTDSRISTSGASEAPESMTVVIFLHPLLVSVLHHLSHTRGCMSISTGSAINGDLMGVIGTSTPRMTFKIFFLLPIPNSSCVVVGQQQGNCC